MEESGCKVMFYLLERQMTIIMKLVLIENISIPSF